MVQITAGKVIFARSVQPAQYETKKAEVELSFSLAEGEELGAWLDDVAAKAQAKALEMVGLKPAQEAKPAATKKAEVKPPTDDEKQKAKEAFAAKQRVGEDIAAAKTLAEKSNTAKTAIDGLDIASLQPGSPAPSLDPDADLLADVPKEVTDQDLVAAVTRKNQELKDPKKIHALRETFVKLPKGLRDIPAADRPRFLAELEALKK
jgi:hypothetical protein